MSRSIRHGLVTFWILLATAALATTETPRTVMWQDLSPDGWQPFDPYRDLPEEQLELFFDSSQGTPEQQQFIREFVESKMSAPVVGELNGQNVRIPGFVVPLSYDSMDVTEFLLVPYRGACIHVPPPPSNQVVYVESATGYPLKELFEPVWVTGEMSTEAFLNDLGDAGYTLKATSIVPYE